MNTQLQLYPARPLGAVSLLDVAGSGNSNLSVRQKGWRVLTPGTLNGTQLCRAMDIGTKQLIKLAVVAAIFLALYLHEFFRIRPPAWFTYMEEARSACARRDFKTAEDNLSKAMAEVKGCVGAPPKYESFTPSSPASLSGELAALAECYDIHGKHDRSEALFKEAIARAAPEDEYFYKGVLAHQYGAHQEYEKAELLFKERFDRSHTPEKLADHLAEFESHASLMELADCYCAQGKWQQAASLYRQDLAQFPPDILSEQDVEELVCLGNCYFAQGRLIYAANCYKRALSLSKTGAGSFAILCDMAEVSIAQERYTEAQALYQRALKMQESTTDPERTSWAQRHYAKLLRRLGKVDQAQELEAAAKRTSLGLSRQPYRPYLNPIFLP
jgi:tetratricopeptide (TPR) repeat protein